MLEFQLSESLLEFSVFLGSKLASFLHRIGLNSLLECNNLLFIFFNFLCELVRLLLDHEFLTLYFCKLGLAIITWLFFSFHFNLEFILVKFSLRNNNLFSLGEEVVGLNILNIVGLNICGSIFNLVIVDLKFLVLVGR